MKNVDATDGVINSLAPYIAAAGDASKRSRWSLLVLIVSSIFGYASFLSARSEAWPWHRLGLLETTRRCMDINAPDHALCTDGDANRAGEFLVRWEYVNTRAKTVAELSKLAVDTTSLKHHVEHQRDIIMDRITSQTVPVLGFGFDANDLGKIATLTFMVMLFVLLLAIRRERQNVQLVRRRAQERSQTSGGQVSLDQVRALIYMRQVFSIIMDEPAERRRPAGFGKKIVYFRPPSMSCAQSRKIYCENASFDPSLFSALC